MRQVLIITYYFPPCGGAGVQRTLKFVKYLRAFDWDPIVLTAQDADYPAWDRSLEKEIPPGVPIYRAPLFEPYKLYRRFTGKKAGEPADMATLSQGRHRQTSSEKISEFLRSSFFVPDARIGWLYPAFHVGKKILADHKIDVIFSSAPPYTTHLIGRKLAAWGQKPWVADFRDSWIGWLSTPQWRPFFARWLERKMERAVLAEAQKILTVSNGVAEDLLSRHPELRDDRWQLLPNGYDAEDFLHAKPAKKSDRFTLVYTGSLYGPRNPEMLIRALENMPLQLAQKFLLRIVGRVDASIIARISTSCVAECFEHIPYVTHAESLGYLLAADAALLIIDDAPQNRGIVTGKVYEYIGAGLPILALAPEGDAAELVRRNQLGLTAAPQDVAAIQSAFLQISAPGFRKGKNSAAGQFERRFLTEQLAAVFNQLVSPATT